MSRETSWVFTENHIIRHTARTLRAVECRYIVYQEEEAPLTGHHHIQGYIAFATPKSRDQVRNLLGGTACVDPARRSAKNNKEYCQKEKSRVTRGISGERGDIPPGQGHRQDLAHLHESLKRSRYASGSKSSDVWESEIDFGPMLKFHAGAERYVETLRQPRHKWTKTITYWGDTGVGKTDRVVRETKELGLDITWMPPFSLAKYWVVPSGKIVVIDDFGPGQISRTTLLRMLDKHPFTPPTKGGFTEWAPEYIFITSNTDPRDWYVSTQTWETTPLYRRLSTQGSRIEEMRDKNIVPPFTPWTGGLGMWSPVEPTVADLESSDSEVDLTK